ncbi:MAG TPA: MBL fold metallo-hydrolase [Actinocrinis sp.]|uniref:MBL fold metallo-hydrolase n=1 Tax=Actinocrinis sp. TaxID=1920516 RepID=UPI002DDD1652|nr:MBL fold metallo-hydrolase [Actinocrinis sp.]HEV2342860.1 MBL fold metallo-hydrolase [Actinocrinis sp.]
MKRPFARPGLSPYDAYRQPSAPPRSGAARVTWLGVSTLLVDDGATALMIDGFFTRPGLLRVLTAKIAPRTRTVAECLRRAGVSRLAAVICAHSHYDHALDAPAVCAQTGALLVGSASTANIGRGQGLPEDRILVPETNSPLAFGTFTATLIESVHSHGDRFPGRVDAPLVPPARPSSWATGSCYSILVETGGGAHSLLIHASANYVPGALRGQHADVVYLGVGELGKATAAFRDAYWNEVVVTTGARRVVPVHWDDFFRSLDRPVRPLRYFADDFGATMRFLLDRAAADGVEVAIPVPWRPADPFAGFCEGSP